MGTLMVSISGIRGIVGDGLDPEIIVKYTNAYANFVGEGKVVVGRDARISGEMVNNLVTGTLLANGIDVIDIGISPTPTVQYNVKELRAIGGIAISASHNPNEWNALKLLNSSGQFLSPDEHNKMIVDLENNKIKYRNWKEIGTHQLYKEGLVNHIGAILKLDVLDIELINQKKFKVVVDCVNGAGAYCVPDLLRELGCEVVEINCKKTGIFPRNPEPIPENLSESFEAVKAANADLGIVVDPDVDRFVLITDKGEPFIEENTITQIVKFILSKEKGNVVINLSTTRAVEDVVNESGCKLFRSAVGEANVVEKMKEVNAVIGGEGSGGVIYPKLHYGRDALVGIVLTLQHLAEFGKSISDLKESLPHYSIAKKIIEIVNLNPDNVINELTDKYKKNKINTDDGLRIDFADHWVHFRKSNTEPIIRIITEAKNKEEAVILSKRYYEKVKEIMRGNQ
jgi:phosphomannomutase